MKVRGKRRHDELNHRTGLRRVQEGRRQTAGRRSGPVAFACSAGRRPSLRVVHMSQFREIVDIPELYMTLFGKGAGDTTYEQVSAAGLADEAERDVER